MSFTDSVVEELYTISSSKSCCQKAFVCGMLFGCRKSDEGREYVAEFYRRADAEKAAHIIDTRFSSGVRTDVCEGTRGGHRIYKIQFSSKSLTGVFFDIDEGRRKDIPSAVGFRCPECAASFMRGVFISSAALSRPKSGYHFEITVRGEKRADALAALIAESGDAMGRVCRSGRIGLYYKSNQKIADLLYFIGAARASFDIANLSIERDIRNNENRATNCVTKNISSSVAATRKHIDAINYLKAGDKLALLSDELTYTAELRLEYDSASLSELAMLHQPPISKSGLNGRLSKILAVYEEVKGKKEQA